MKFSIREFFSKCDQIRSFLRIWSYLLKKSFIENFIFCGVSLVPTIPKKEDQSSFSFDCTTYYLILQQNIHTSLSTLKQDLLENLQTYISLIIP